MKNTAYSSLAPASSGSIFAAMTAAALLAVALIMSTTGPASAQVVKRGVQGGVAGAIIGGVVGGGKGVGKGAAIGAGVGVVAGAIEADQNKHRQAAYPPPPPPPGYVPPPQGYPQLVANTQASLARLGYSPGPVDGQMGPATAGAIRDYQYAWRLPVTGQPSYALLDHMKRNGG